MIYAKALFVILIIFGFIYLINKTFDSNPKFDEIRKLLAEHLKKNPEPTPNRRSSKV